MPIRARLETYKLHHQRGPLASCAGGNEGGERSGVLERQREAGDGTAGRHAGDSRIRRHSGRDRGTVFAEDIMEAGGGLFGVDVIGGDRVQHVAADAPGDGFGGFGWGYGGTRVPFVWAAAAASASSRATFMAQSATGTSTTPAGALQPRHCHVAQPSLEAAARPDAYDHSGECLVQLGTREEIRSKETGVLNTQTRCSLFMAQSVRKPLTRMASRWEGKRVMALAFTSARTPPSRLATTATRT